MATPPVARHRTLKARIYFALVLLRGIVSGIVVWLAFMYFAISFDWFWIKGPGDGEELPLLNQYPLVPLVLIVVATTWLSVAVRKVDRDAVESQPGDTDERRLGRRR